MNDGYERMIAQSLIYDNRSDTEADFRIIYRHEISRWHVVDERGQRDEGSGSLFTQHKTHVIVGMYSATMGACRVVWFCDYSRAKARQSALMEAYDEFDAAGLVVAHGHDAIRRQIGGYRTQDEAEDALTAMVRAEQVVAADPVAAPDDDHGTMVVEI